MTDPRTAREALILQSLGELDEVLSKVDAVSERATHNAQRLEDSAVALDNAGSRFGAELDRLTADTKKALTEFIERRASATTSDAMSSYRKAMQEAATLAFAEQLAPAIRDFTRQLEQHDGPRALKLQPGHTIALAILIFVLGTTVGLFFSMFGR